MNPLRNLIHEMPQIFANPIDALLVQSRLVNFTARLAPSRVLHENELLEAISRAARTPTEKAIVVGARGSLIPSWNRAQWVQAWIISDANILSITLVRGSGRYAAFKWRSAKAPIIGRYTMSCSDALTYCMARRLLGKSPISD